LNKFREETDKSEKERVKQIKEKEKEKPEDSDFETKKKKEEDAEEEEKNWREDFGKLTKVELCKKYGLREDNPELEGYNRLDIKEKKTKPKPLTKMRNRDDIKITTMDNSEIDLDSIAPHTSPKANTPKEKRDAAEQQAKRKAAFEKDYGVLTKEELLKEYDIDPDDPKVQEAFKDYRQLTDEELEERDAEDEKEETPDTKDKEEEGTKNLPEKTTKSEITSPENAKEGAVALAPQVMNQALQVVSPKDLYLAVYKGETTFQKNGRTYLNKTAKVLGESMFARLAAYAVGFALLGPFGLLLAHEGMSLVKDTADAGKEKEEIRKANRQETNLRSQAKHVDKIIPDHFSEQQRHDFRQDFGRMTPEEFAKKHWQALSQDYIHSNMPKDFTEEERKEFLKDLGRLIPDKDNPKPYDDFKAKYSGKLDVDGFITNCAEKTKGYMRENFSPEKYMTYGEQIEKLHNAVPGKNGIYEVPLYGDVVFHGDEKDMKEHLRTLDSRSKGQDYSDDDADYRSSKGKFTYKDKKLDPKSKTKSFDKDVTEMTGAKMYEKYKAKVAGKLSEDDFKNVEPLDVIEDALDKCEKRGINAHGVYTLEIMGEKFSDSDFENLEEDVRAHQTEITQELMAKFKKAGLEQVMAADLEEYDLKKLPNDLRSKIKEVHKEAPEGSEEDLLVKTAEEKKSPVDEPLEVKESEVVTPIEEDVDAHKDELMESVIKEDETEKKDDSEQPDIAPDASETVEIEPPEDGDEEDEILSDEAVVSETIEKIVEHYLKQDPVKLRAYFEKKYPKMLAKYNKKKEAEGKEEKTPATASWMKFDESDV
jgi:hypothetical protein